MYTGKQSKKGAEDWRRSASEVFPRFMKLFVTVTKQDTVLTTHYKVTVPVS